MGGTAEAGEHKYTCMWLVFLVLMINDLVAMKRAVQRLRRVADDATAMQPIGLNGHMGKIFRLSPETSTR